jgi:hypothetical protein
MDLIDIDIKVGAHPPFFAPRQSWIEKLTELMGKLMINDDKSLTGTVQRRIEVLSSKHCSRKHLSNADTVPVLIYERWQLWRETWKSLLLGPEKPVQSEYGM